MTSHRSRHRRSALGQVRAIVTSVPLRLALCLGMVLGFGAIGTVASWNDTATITGGSFTSGTLDLQVGAAAADQLAGQGGTWNYTTLALSDMLPGESIARVLTIKNSGTTPLTYNGTIKTSNDDLGTFLQATIIKDGAVSNAGTQAAGNRVGTCGTGPIWQTALTLSSTAQTMAPATVTLTSQQSTTLCVKIGLLTSATNFYQAKTTSLTMLFTANQP